MTMTPEQSRESLEAMMRAGQAFMQNFFQQFSQIPNAAAAPAPVPPVALPGLSSLGVDAEKFAQLQREHLEQHAKLWASVAARKADEPAAEPVVAAVAKDRRFAAPAWSASPFYDYLRQAYVLNSQFLTAVTEALPINDKGAKSRLQFMTKQYVEALSPANFAATNPEFVQRALDTKGESITAGIMNMIADMEKGRISMTDDTAFEVGVNLATTQGSVIYENEVMQLIQYAPLSEKVSETPFLIVPPCINKYYILDLQAENSFVRYVVEQGFTVFLVSWRNPKAEQSTLSWDDYVGDGVLKAIDVVREVSKVAKPNILGFCIGGTLVASALAVAYARGEDPVESVTFLTTLLDFSDTGEIACFVDETAVAAKEATIGNGGLLNGRELSNIFSSLRPNDLIWNYVVDNYLKGNKPPAFDLLYWNSDSTNMPGPFAAWYLRNTYLENNLRIPGKLEVLGEKVDLGRIKVPAYFMAAREDHIVPWQTAYLGRRLVSGETTFVLGASGHIAGVVNPAAKNKRSYWVGEQDAASAEEWFNAAQEQKGSWWPHWIEWLRARSGKQIATRTRLGNRQYKQMEAAPGRYVKEML
ncbi:class I poly(R)-hydroxyalkanoic acid synthase [Uliginosibacterium sediminicola]|uniref:Class I poly(R)-hydroxyalkanoic acid synthase n=1 Tax=Uliginosibacterium sediminicola TaxID=2024550 RepID=A0ABU9Z1N3_9RHOO